ncbi:Chaperone protein HscA [Nocardia cerradoensis]|uniref:Chaperone protein HscA n=1 Tax=Nocardia cerradoensis TaxID=85688 RepID=A0A231H927_9NOCA|nr:Hsp70 family protein [Nocardia cerradoensis]OXR45197.1 Chaperone protein HscA [Nocardia cerradoensis]
MDAMVLVLGVSAGAGGARAMLTHSDQPHLPPIDRCVVARRAGAGVEEPVFQAIDAMRASAADRDEFVTGIAVTSRCALHAEAIRAAAGRSRLTIIDEPPAQLRYLRFSGQLPDEGAVLLYDLGSSGLTLTEADCHTQAILAAKRSTLLGGDGHDALLRWHLAHGGVEIDNVAGRVYKEQLSSTRVVTVGDPRSGTRIVVTRSDFRDLVAAGIHHSVSYVRQLIDDTGVAPRAVALLGGCTRSPGIRESLEQLLDLPVIYDPEPDFVSARGAVLMATEQPAARRVRGIRFAPPQCGSAAPTPRPAVSRRKVVAALAVTAALGATVTGLLVTGHDSARPAHDGTPARPVEVAGSSAEPVPGK